MTEPQSWFLDKCEDRSLWHDGDESRSTASSLTRRQAAVQRYLDGRDIEIVAGLEGEDLVLTFIDTDNFFHLHGTGVFYRQQASR